MANYNKTSATSRRGNVGAQQFNGNIGKDRFLILVPKGAVIATKTLALTKGTWETNFNTAADVRWFPLIPAVDAKPTQGEAKFQEFDFGYKSFVQDGKLNVIYVLDEMSTYNKNQLNKLTLGDFDVFIGTDKNRIRGWSADDIFFNPFAIDFFTVLPESQNTGSEVAHVSVQMQFSDINQFNMYDVAIDPMTDPDAPAPWYTSLVFSGIKDLIATPSTGSASGFTLDLRGFDGVAYRAAVAADVLIYKSTAPTVAIACSTLTESAVPGVYAATWATQTAGTFSIGLKSQPSATTKWVETPAMGTLIWV